MYNILAGRLLLSGLHMYVNPPNHAHLLRSKCIQSFLAVTSPPQPLEYVVDGRGCSGYIMHIYIYIYIYNYYICVYISLSLLLLLLPSVEELCLFVLFCFVLFCFVLFCVLVCLRLSLAMYSSRVSPYSRMTIYAHTLWSSYTSPYTYICIYL